MSHLSNLRLGAHLGLTPEASIDVLNELGVNVPESREVRVWDSTAEIRYMVLPERPKGTEKLSEDELAALITRDAMIGVAEVKR